MVEGVLDGGEDEEVFVAGAGRGGAGGDADVNVLRAEGRGKEGRSEEEQGEVGCVAHGCNDKRRNEKRQWFTRAFCETDPRQLAVDAISPG